jgi:hypothetical protein
MLPKGEATYPRGLARAQLAAVYLNVLREFLRLEYSLYQVRRLRLLPLSGGIFAGDLLLDIPKLTFEALEDAIGSLSIPQREVLEELEVALHVYREDEWCAFVAAGAAHHCDSEGSLPEDMTEELRVDEQDGLAYSKEEFAAYYRGLREWNVAR